MSIFWVIIIVLALYLMFLYNQLVARKIACDNNWSQIDVQLKRRYDLIPNLVETVKGYAKHESSTLENVIKARNSAMQIGSTGNLAEKAGAENMLSGALKQLFALSESYPDLKANQNFASLQGELASTENSISYSRQAFNDAVGLYNSSILSFPANMFAASFGFQPRTFFELSGAEAEAVKQAPKVSF